MLSQRKFLTINFYRVLFWIPVLTQQPQNPQPCIDDCLAEALANDPVQGCPAGTVFEAWPVTAPAASCRPCPAGFYCPGTPYGEFLAYKVNLNRKIACPVGTFRSTISAQSLSDCTHCPGGSYQDWYGKASCIPCPAGTFVNTTKSDSIRDCISCLPGHYCPTGSVTGSVNPTPCPAGSYTSYPRMKQLSNCQPCPRGHYCPSGTSHPIQTGGCPAGQYANTTGTISAAACTPCPSSFFCPQGSLVPTSCPPGTTSGTGTARQTDCVPCPVGFQCRQLSDSAFAQSLVVRDGNNDQLVGGTTPQACLVDVTIRHPDYPNFTGCVEACPFLLPHQSFCHVAGDGRVPDRAVHERALGELISKRTHNGQITQVEQNNALTAINATLYSMNTTDRLGVLSMTDHNARTPLMLAAMLGDVPLLTVLCRYGANITGLAARDAGGFTALMHALHFGHAAAAEWLQNHAGARLAPTDVTPLVDRGVSVVGVLVAPLATAPAYLGRGGVTWTHPNRANFTPSIYNYSFSAR